MNVQLMAYNSILTVARCAAGLLAPFNEKIAEGLSGRKGLEERWRSGAASLERKSLLIWFHVSSVGEYLQAKPVIDLLSERTGPGLEIALTFFSPSGMNYFKKFDRSKRSNAVRFVDYLPVDSRRNARFCIDTLNPDMIVYVKFDLWPNLIIEASERGIPQILVSGTLSPGSKRLAKLVQGFYGELYSRLTAIAAISDEDAERFRKCSHGPVEIFTAGDTRFDQVCRRIDTSTVKLPDVLLGDERLHLIAGSTWPRDEAVVIPGFRRLLGNFPDICLVLAPHEPTPGRLADISRELEKENLPFTYLSKLVDTGKIEKPVIVADGVGYLAELYRTGRVAYVGGSFTTGVHNVMEPAVLALPVLFGPRIENSYEARKLVELEAGRIVNNPADFEKEVSELLSDRELLNSKGKTGRQFIRNHCGAAMLCLDLIEKHL